MSLVKKKSKFLQKKKKKKKKKWNIKKKNLYNILYGILFQFHGTVVHMHIIIM
jgi:hypothetical protein